MRLLALAVAALLLTAGCSSSAEPDPPSVVDHGDESASPPPGTAPSGPSAGPTDSAAADPTGTATPTPVVPADFNPCDGLLLAPVARQLHTPLSKDVGDADNRRCGLLPAAPDGPVITVTYQSYGDTLDHLLDGIGEDPATVDRPDVPGADDARLLVSLRNDDRGTSVFVTGFVQLGGLVEVVNGADPPPYDAGDDRDLVRATLLVMQQLAAAAPPVGPRSSARR